MESIQNSNSPLETEPLKRLLVRYSIPTTLTLMVNFLYNIVDQIFVGHGVGITGMAAVNVTFPVSILISSIALLLGDGCAANVSLCLGKKDQHTADSIFGHTITLILCSGIILALLCGCFSSHIVLLFGSSDTALGESTDYLRAISWGIPFQLICPAFTAMIRADGSPSYSMKCMMSGAIINLILDPLFIFGLNMGVVGAGIATVIGEVASGTLCLLYLRKLKSIHLTWSALHPTWPLTRMILHLGFPSLLTQALSALVQIVLNNLLRFYGACSVYGSDIALSVYGMMMKIYQIAHSMFVGVSSAIQPINGYNFGAKKYARVQQTYHMALKIALCVSLLWFLIYQFFAKQIATLFVNGNVLYLECAQLFFHLYMMAFFLYGMHMTTASLFQSIGKPMRSLFIPLLRQACLLVPLAIVLSHHMGLNGALLAAPIADVLTSLLCALLARMEFHKWKRQGWI